MSDYVYKNVDVLPEGLPKKPEDSGIPGGLGWRFDNKVEEVKALPIGTVVCIYQDYRQIVSVKVEPDNFYDFSARYFYSASRMSSNNVVVGYSPPTW